MSPSSSISDLPPEILSRIFASALNHPLPLDSSGRQQFSALQLVCKSWWMTALSTPVLWRSLEVTTPRNDEGMDAIERWFSRGGDISGPYALVVCEPDDRAYSELPSGTVRIRLSQILGKYTWCELGLPDWYFLGSVTKPQTIERLSLRRGIIYSVAPAVRHVQDFSALHSLHHTHLNQLPSSGPGRTFSHPNVVNLHLTSCFLPSSRDYAHILSPGSLPVLREVILEQCRALYIVIQDASEAMVNPNITRLIVSGDSLSVLSSTSLPSLRFLRLTGLRSRGDRIESQQLVQKSPNLETLSLEDSSLDPSNVAAIINSISESAAPPRLALLFVRSAKFIGNLALVHQTPISHLRTLVILDPLRDEKNLGRITNYFATRVLYLVEGAAPLRMLTKPASTLQNGKSSGRKSCPTMPRVKGVEVEETSLPDLGYPIQGHRYAGPRKLAGNSSN